MRLYWVPKHHALQSHRSAAAGPLSFPPVDVASRFILSCPVLISLSVDNFFGLCRSLSTFILASLLVMPKTPEKRTTDFHDCAVTPKKRRKKRVMVDVDETQTDVDSTRVLYVSLHVYHRDHFVWRIFTYESGKQPSRVLHKCTLQNQSFLRKLRSFI